MARRMPLARAPLAGVVTLALGLAACGGSSGDDGGKDAAAVPAQPKPTATAQDFPSSKGRTLPDIIGTLPEGPVLAPTVSVLEKGRDRVAFALFDKARKQMTGAAVAVYVGRTDGTGARGPYVARSESLAVRPQFRSRTTSEDPDAAKSIYVVDVPFPREGKVAIVAIAKLDGRLVSSNPQAMQIGGEGRRPPGVGDKAPVIHTLTRADVGGDLSKIDTRNPPLEQLHDVDAAKVLGKKPAVLIFATPALCSSRVCGPVVDIAAQVQSEVGDKVKVIHQEIYTDNDPNKGNRPQVTAYRLPTEPWVFVVGADGRISSRMEGAFSVGELRRAVDKVLPKS